MIHKKSCTWSSNVAQTYMKQIGYTDFFHCVGEHSSKGFSNDFFSSVGPVLRRSFLVLNFYWNVWNIEFQKWFEYELIDFEYILFKYASFLRCHNNRDKKMQKRFKCCSFLTTWILFKICLWDIQLCSSNVKVLFLCISKSESWVLSMQCSFTSFLFQYCILFFSKQWWSGLLILVKANSSHFQFFQTLTIFWRFTPFLRTSCVLNFFIGVCQWNCSMLVLFVLKFFFGLGKQEKTWFFLKYMQVLDWSSSIVQT